MKIRAARQQGKGIKKIATEIGVGVSIVQRVVHGSTHQDPFAHKEAQEIKLEASHDRR